jgi:hypothetical protein
MGTAVHSSASSRYCFHLIFKGNAIKINGYLPFCKPKVGGSNPSPGIPAEAQAPDAGFIPTSWALAYGMLRPTGPRQIMLQICT